ncbi:MAG: branched-chain amino acid transaminase [Thermoanaerobaculia bacterium]
MQLPRYAFFNGKIVPYADARVGVLTHALNYGTGCFAGLRGYWNSEEKQLFVFRPRDHFRRFLESARLLAMELPFTEDDLVEHALELVRREDLKTDSYIRPLAFLSDETLGVRLHDLTPAVSMVAFPFGKYMENDEAHLTFSAWLRIHDGMIPARGKITGGYVNSALARTAAQKAGFDDALLLNKNGHVSEASVSNFFMVRHGEVITPAITDDILEGITRRTLIGLLRDEMGLKVIERSIDRTEVYLAEEAFLAGTGVQIVPVTRIDHRRIGSGSAGRIGLDLKRLYDEIVRGRIEKYRSWCRPVYAAQPAPVRA